MENGHIRFALTRNGETIASSFTRENFDHYINRSMPIGKYELTCTVFNVTVSNNHTHWWDQEVHTGVDANVLYHGFTRTFVFEVQATEVEFTLSAATFGGYPAYEWELNAENKNGFFAPFENAVRDKVNLATVARAGYWATSAANEYYGNYSLSYNLLRMNNQEYFSAADANLTSLIKGGESGTYTVYFNITAPNHAPLTDMGEVRYDYYFTVTVYETLAVPTVNADGLVYTGNKVLPEIAEDGKYNIVWSDTDTYIAGGAHSVSFELTDSVHYRWNGVDGNTSTVKFTVSKADNTFTVALNMLGWNFETFDAAVKFLDSGKCITFRVTKKGETAVVTGLDGFTIDGNGKVNDTVAVLLNGLKTGDYTLCAKVEEAGNYNALERNIEFKVSKSMNAWADGDEDLTLPSWIVGKYNTDENPIVVNAAHGTVNIIITDIDGNEYYNSVTGVNKLNDCGVGKYLLKAWVDETENFAALAERTFTIEVLEKIGLPWWGTLLITLGALLVAALIIFILWKKGVFQILTQNIVVAIRTRASVEATIASVRTAKKMEEGKQSVADAKRRERIEEMRRKAAKQRALPLEERAAQLEAKAEAEAEKAGKIRMRSEALKVKAEKMRGASAQQQQPTNAEQEAAATEDTGTRRKNKPSE